MGCLVIVPTYNELENISALIPVLRSQGVEVLVVDDNSPDGTAQQVRELSRNDSGIHLLLRQNKDGLAAAYRAGIQWALQKHYDPIVQMDADFSHPPELVPRLLEALSNHDLVMGSRYSSGGGTRGWSLRRRIISRCGNLYAMLTLGLPLKDLTGGFLAWRRDLLEQIDVVTTSARGYAFLIELKYRAYLIGARLGQVPFVFPDRTKGQSKMSATIFWEAALSVLRLRLHRQSLSRQLNDRKAPRESRDKVA